ncbi:complement factor H-like isoform X3 [Girardinichthys multiradiatus]|uniref:complement factor H-like isoform X3 n=1 Tax=Girardinichthys multiradiatus TaxID=208333 RepID=UPI001FAD0C26|nr:complement factor H-like isoform X3 [Girardinichthys multiradiatus]
MWLRGLGLALLVWSPGVLHAIHGEGPCSTPSLKDGYFVPVQDSYPHGTLINYSCDTGYKPTVEGWWATSQCENGEWSDEPQCVASSAKPGTKETQPSSASIDICGDHPQVPNGVVVEEERRYLKYQCRDYYKLVGSDTVVCHSDGTWSEVPRCKEDFCLLRAGDHSDLILTIDKYFRNGEAQWLDCVDKWSFPNYSEVRCINGELQASRCCNRVQIQTGIC